MAKKKTETTEAGGEAAKPKKAAAKKAVKKSAPAAAAKSGGSPMIDTNLAAQNAARILSSRAKLGAAASGEAGGTRESEGFKQMKQSLNKPASEVGGLGNALGPQKTHLPVKQYNQIFHNQTQGGVARLNVPRRTNG